MVSHVFSILWKIHDLQQYNMTYNTFCGFYILTVALRIAIFGSHSTNVTLYTLTPATM